MQVHQDIVHLPSFKNAVLTIGTFDGVHLGHRQILLQLKAEAERIKGETVIITFHPHPRKVISSAQPPISLINTIEEKIELLEALKIDHLVVVPFDQRFSQMSAQEYIEEFLLEKFQPHTIIIGYDHHFGKGRSGNYLLLEEYSKKSGFRLIEISSHTIAENAVSSTRIRQSLTEGDIDAANNLLGYDYFFEGKVIEGNRLGRTLGYPTANLEISDKEKLIPAYGIYVVEAELERRVLSKKAEIRRLKGMMSIGIRPTLSDGKFMIEINLFDFNEDIYGRTLRVYVKKYLRPEMKFDGLEALKEQLAKDKKDTLAYFHTRIDANRGAN
ncbi:MAG: bifunctional riboflavin kinase/FAD synthetase [Chitinophagaceae bacterium]|nr:bifunctional riboflavin kinase/FAD synthetase [Chitinophagaceae bacterium]